MNSSKPFEKLSDSTVRKPAGDQAETEFSFPDDSVTDWTVNEETRCRERVLNYKVPYESALVGRGTVITREKQVSRSLLLTSSMYSCQPGQPIVSLSRDYLIKERDAKDLHFVSDFFDRSLLISNR